MPYLTVEWDMRGSRWLAFGGLRLDYESRGNGLLRVVRLALCVESDRIVLCATEEISICKPLRHFGELSTSSNLARPERKPLRS